MLNANQEKENHNHSFIEPSNQVHRSSNMSYQSNIKVRKVDNEDSRHFTPLLNTLGGIGLFRAIFGQFSFSSLVEYCLTTLITIVNDGEGDEGEEAVAFISVNDNISSTADADLTEKMLTELSNFFPAQVYT